MHWESEVVLRRKAFRIEKWFIGAYRSTFYNCDLGAENTKKLVPSALWMIDVPWYSEYFSLPHKDQQNQHLQKNKTIPLQTRFVLINWTFHTFPTTFTLGFGSLALLTSSRVQISSTPQCGWNDVGEVSERSRKLTDATLGNRNSSNIPWVRIRWFPRG